jgi:hypothetical protein
MDLNHRWQREQIDRAIEKIDGFGRLAENKRGRSGGKHAFGAGFI